MLYGNVIIFSFASRVTNLLLIPPPRPNINWIIPKLNPKLIPSPCCAPYIELNSMRHGSEYWWREFCSIDFTKHRICECRDQPQERQLLWVIIQVIKCMKAKYPTHPRCGLQTALSYICLYLGFHHASFVEVLSLCLKTSSLKFVNYVHINC